MLEVPGPREKVHPALSQGGPLELRPGLSGGCREEASGMLSFLQGLSYNKLWVLQHHDLGIFLGN